MPDMKATFFFLLSYFEVQMRVERKIISDLVKIISELI